jgi:hypothetical protein
MRLAPKVESAYGNSSDKKCAVCGKTELQNAQLTHKLCNTKNQIKLNFFL